VRHNDIHKSSIISKKWDDGIFNVSCVFYLLLHQEHKPLLALNLIRVTDERGSGQNIRLSPAMWERQGSASHLFFLILRLKEYWGTPRCGLSANSFGSTQSFKPKRWSRKHNHSITSIRNTQMARRICPSLYV